MYDAKLAKEVRVHKSQWNLSDNCWVDSIDKVTCMDWMDNIFPKWYLKYRFGGLIDLYPLCCPVHCVAVLLMWCSHPPQINGQCLTLPHYHYGDDAASCSPAGGATPLVEWRCALVQQCECVLAEEDHVHGPLWRGCWRVRGDAAVGAPRASLTSCRCLVARASASSKPDCLSSLRLS